MYMYSECVNAVLMYPRWWSTETVAVVVEVALAGQGARGSWRTAVWN